jgi:hypothetical protein
MTPRPLSHGVVSLPALDVRSRPDHRAELRSQFLLGEVLRRRGASPDGLWWKARSLVDGYEGWVRTWGLVEASARRVDVWRRRALARVVVPHAEVRTGPGSGVLVSPLFWNGRLIAGRSRGRFRAVELPDGRRGWVSASALHTGARPPARLSERVLGLLGVPYLWGGRTPLGMDCSAFTQQVLMEQNVFVPRDAAQQFRASRALRDGEPAREGDLVFFGAAGRPVGHVGLALGGGYYAHSRGRIRIASLDPENPLCDSELMLQFRGVRRPLSGSRKRLPVAVRRARFA